jgi:O-antigen/teichoic acid export membrane protein
LIRKLFKESLIYGLSGYIGKFIGVFLLPLYTAALQPSDYGILDLLGTISLISSFLIISGTDAAFAFFYFRKEYEQQRNEIVSTTLWIRIIFSGIVLVAIIAASPLISQILFGSNKRLFIVITGLTVCFTAVFSLFQELLRYEFKPWLYTIFSSSSILLNVLLTIYFVLITRQGVYGAIIASCISYGALAVFALVFVIKKYGFKINKNWFKEIVKYGYPLIGTGVAVWVLTSTDRYFLAHYSDLTAVGIYAVGLKIAAFLSMIAGAFQMAWGPFALEIQYEDNARKIYGNIFFLFCSIGLFGIFFASIFSIDILKVFTQPAYYNAKIVVPFLCTSTFFSAGYFLVVLGMNLSKKLVHTIWITITAAITNIILNYALTPWLGAIGASFSVMIANFLIFVLTFRTSQKFYFIPFKYSKLIYLALPAALIIILAYYFNLRFIPRLILSFLYSIFSAIFVYKSFKHTEELKKILKKISDFKHKLSTQTDSNNLNL